MASSSSNAVPAAKDVGVVDVKQPSEIDTSGLMTAKEMHHAKTTEAPKLWVKQHILEPLYDSTDRSICVAMPNNVEFDQQVIKILKKLEYQVSFKKTIECHHKHSLSCQDLYMRNKIITPHDQLLFGYLDLKNNYYICEHTDSAENHAAECHKLWMLVSLPS